MYRWSRASCFGGTPLVLWEAIRSRKAVVHRARSSLGLQRPHLRSHVTPQAGPAAAAPRFPFYSIPGYASFSFFLAGTGRIHRGKVWRKSKCGSGFCRFGRTLTERDDFFFPDFFPDISLTIFFFLKLP